MGKRKLSAEQKEKMQAGRKAKKTVSLSDVVQAAAALQQAAAPKARKPKTPRGRKPRTKEAMRNCRTFEPCMRREILRMVRDAPPAKLMATLKLAKQYLEWRP